MKRFRVIGLKANVNFPAGEERHGHSSVEKNKLRGGGVGSIE